MFTDPNDRIGTLDIIALILFFGSLVVIIAIFW